MATEIIFDEKLFSTEKEAKLWNEYWKLKSNIALNKLIEYYAPLVKKIVRDVKYDLPPSVTEDELISAGSLGLYDAIQKFNPGRNVKFTVYAKQRIRGSILDELRRIDVVPRNVRQQIKKVREAYKILEQEYGRPPVDKEIADYLNITLDELSKIYKWIAFVTRTSPEDPIFSNDDGEITRAETIEGGKADPEKEIEKKELKKRVLEALKLLSEKEKIVLDLYYTHGLSQKKIARILNVSDSRVSQLHSNAIFKLRNYLGKYAADWMNL